MRFSEDDLERLSQEALKGGERSGNHFNVAIGDYVAVKVPNDISLEKGKVQLETVDENIEIARSIGKGMLEATLEKDILKDRFTVTQPAGRKAVQYAENYPRDFVRQTVDIMDHVASETAYILDSKFDNFVTLNGDVKYCDYGDGASFSQGANDHMYRKFISDLTEKLGFDFAKADRMVAGCSEIYETVVAEAYLE